MTELNKFGVIGILHFHKGILSSHGTKFSFQKLQYICLEEYELLHKRETLIY